MSPLGNAAIQILVVEDDALTRLATRERIEAAGFKVYEAYHADEAIQSLESHPDHLYGCHMPGSMDGVKLAHFVREMSPPVKIIVTSGFKHVTPDQLPSGSVFLGKPYLPDQLTRHIKSLVDA